MYWYNTYFRLLTKLFFFSCNIVTRFLRTNHDEKIQRSHRFRNNFFSNYKSDLL